MSKKVISLPCSGSHTYRSTYKGRRLTSGSPKYPCPICKKLVRCDISGNFYAHGYKYVDKKDAPRMINDDDVSLCAACGKVFEGIDYLCKRCRA